MLPRGPKGALLVFLIIEVSWLLSWRFLTESFANCALQNSLKEHHHALHTHTLSKAMDDQLWNGVVVRAFPPWPATAPLPCSRADPLRWWTPNVTRSPLKEGIMFAKEMKTGSSTVSGITIRIARNIARRKNLDFMCESRFDHFPGMDMKFIERDPKKTFLFTVLRNPQTRVTSQFFHFLVSRKKTEPTDANFQDFILNFTYMHNYYLKDLGLVPYQDVERRMSVRRHQPLKMENNSLLEMRLRLVNDIMKGYDFIGITERMDESLVALMMLLRLKISDIVYIKAKSSGGFDDGASLNTCVYIVPSFVSPGMQAFFQSPTYQTLSGGDWMLYRASEASLNRTIDGLGRTQFNRNLVHFKAAQKVVNAKCSEGIRYPCSAGGVRAPYTRHSDPATDCLWLDSGCGYECLDSLEEEIERLVENYDVAVASNG